MELQAIAASLEPHPDHERVLSLLKRHGWNATSFQILEPGFRYWFDGDDACVAYADTGGAWVAAGAPIAPAERLAAVARRFVESARRARRRACFFAAEERFRAETGLPCLLLGEQPVWDPRGWAATLAGSRSLREQLRRARAKGVTVRELSAAEVADGASAPRRAIDALVDRWQRSRPMPPLGFLVEIHLFSFCSERRYFLAEQGGRAVGVLVAVPVYARKGWLIEDFLRHPEAPNGTAELLVHYAVSHAAIAGSAYATLGLAPLAGPVGPALRLARRATAALYNFEGLRAFKAKLKPRAWDPIYLAHPEGSSAALALADALGAFARGRLVRFGMTALLRAPELPIRASALLLVPWTVFLACAPARWFPSAAGRWGWVAFHVLLAAALFQLGARFRPRLATALAAAFAGSAALTLLQALSFDLRAQRPLEVAVLAIAVLAPLATALLLWGAIRARYAAIPAHLLGPEPGWSARRGL
jgi:phosphatidylglycerol lysyltransferase